MFNKIEVGKLFQEGKTHYVEGCKVDMADDGLTFFVAFQDPSEEEINNFKDGKIKYGYYVEKDVIMLLFKIGSQQWMDAPYSIHLSKQLHHLQEIKDGLGYSLKVFLVDANTGILKAARMIGMETNMSRKIKEEILKQKDMDFNILNYNKNIAEIYNKYTTKELVKKGNVIY